MKLKTQLEHVKTVGLAGHVKPDGDCVGSTLAVYNYLKTYYPQIEVTLYLEPIPNIFKFLSRSAEIVHDCGEDKAYDLFIAMDCGDADRLGEAAKYSPLQRKPSVSTTTSATAALRMKTISFRMQAQPVSWYLNCWMQGRSQRRSRSVSMWGLSMIPEYSSIPVHRQRQ